MIEQWSNLLRKTVIALYFPAEEETVCLSKKRLSVNSTSHDLDASFL